MKIHAYLNEFKRTANYGMIIAIIGVIFCICFDSWNDLLGAFRSNTGNVHYFFWNSAFGGTCRYYFLPIFTTLPFATSFCKEYNENSLPFIVARKGKAGYCISKYITNALCGGFVVAFGTALLFVLLASKFPVADISYEDVKIADSSHFWIATYYPFWYGVVEAANGFLTGLLWSCVALFVSAYVPNSFVTITSPYLASFALTHAFRLYKVDYRFNKWLTGDLIIGSSVQTLVLSSITVLIIISILGFLFTKKVRRRIEYELHR